MEPILESWQLMRNSHICRCGKTLESTENRHFEAVIPMYKSADLIPDLLEYLDKLAGIIEGRMLATVVVDGNSDKTFEILTSAIGEKNTNWDWKIIQLSRNFGVGPALMAGFGQSKSCVCVAFGSDLQEPINLFKEFQMLLQNPNLNIVLGTRRTRKDPMMNKLFSQIYWFFYRKFISPETPKGGFDVCALSESARRELIKLSEKNSNITAQMDWIGFSRKYVEFDRLPRNHGKSTWSFGRKLKLFLDSFYTFTDFPIRIMQFLSLSSLSVLTVLGIIILTSWSLGLINVPGYTSIVFIQLFTANIIICCVAILAGYVTRTFDNTKKRPIYIIERQTESN